MVVTLFTIGFAGHSAAEFFERLRCAGVRRVLDVRLNNTSQLAGFTKKEDLRYFLRAIGGIDYLHVPEFAPTPELFEAYKKQKGSWAAFAAAFRRLLVERAAQRVLTPAAAHLGCLLCSEKEPQHCHRRLVTEHLERHWPAVRVEHLV